MKRKIVMSNRFRKDLKLVSKQGHDMKKLTSVIDALSRDELLDLKYHDHNLTGRLSGFRECHVEPDLLLIYKKEERDFILLLFRIGSHSQLV